MRPLTEIKTAKARLEITGMESAEGSAELELRELKDGGYNLICRTLRLSADAFWQPEELCTPAASYSLPPEFSEKGSYTAAAAKAEGKITITGQITMEGPDSIRFERRAREKVVKMPFKPKEPYLHGAQITLTIGTSCPGARFITPGDLEIFLARAPETEIKYCGKALSL